MSAETTDFASNDDLPAEATRRAWPFGRIFKLGVILALCLWVYSFTSVYSVQPIGALPSGATIIVWRTQGAPFFDSPDATCLRRLNEVTLFCRAIALAKGPVLEYKILSLPYFAWAYEISTGGREYN
jgi:hypothetical protein